MIRVRENHNEYNDLMVILYKFLEYFNLLTSVSSNMVGLGSNYYTDEQFEKTYLRYFRWQIFQNVSFHSTQNERKYFLMKSFHCHNACKLSSHSVNDMETKY